MSADKEEKMKMALARTVLALVAFGLALAGTARAEMRTCGSPDQVDTINEMFAALYACWEPPRNAGGMSMTLTFSLRSNGTIIGSPRRTHARLGDDQKLNEAFVASVHQALERAVPLPLSKSMGGAIAGRLLAPRFVVVDE
jgi:hypothetical protein